MKRLFREKAILLRQNGLSYSEILSQTPVAKSTLSLWLRSVKLAKKQEQRLTEKKLSAIKRGAEKRRQQRLEIVKEIKKKAYKDLESIVSQRELLFMGIMLYWAEGAKIKEHNISQGVVFSNSDYRMIVLFLKWLISSMKIDKERIAFEIYVHENSKERIDDIKRFWSEKTGFNIVKFDRIYWKRDKLQTSRKNVSNKYFGLLRVKVKRSTNLNRQIAAWTEAIVKKCGVV